MPFNVVAFERGDRSIVVLRTSQGVDITADEFVLAAVVASKKLACTEGINLPLTEVRGYRVTLGKANVIQRRALVYPQRGFALTPFESGLSAVGGIEIAGEESTPNWRRVDKIAQYTRRILPDLQFEPCKPRMGVRPFTPDTKPIIGRCEKLSKLVFTGHRQLGITLSATTARLVGSIVSKLPAEQWRPAYTPDRVNK